MSQFAHDEPGVQLALTQRLLACGDAAGSLGESVADDIRLALMRWLELDGLPSFKGTCSV